MKNSIEIIGLTKRFGELLALDNLSFEVGEGELFAFLGANGAGKSTTINIMCSQLEKNGGRVIIDGLDIDLENEKIKGRLGVVFQGSVLDSALSVYDNLKSRAALYGIVGAEFKGRLFELSQMLDFSTLLRRQVGKLSGGQRRRIDLARALIHKPKILILDEPTTGLDPQSRRTIWQVISRLRREENMTVLLTTHYMEEAADADNVIIIDSGKIVAKGTPAELKSSFARDFITLYGIDEASAGLLSPDYEKIGGAYRIAVSSTAEAVDLIVKHPEMFTDFEVTKGKMDDVFLTVTGKTLVGGEEHD